MPRRPHRHTPSASRTLPRASLGRRIGMTAYGVVAGLVTIALIAAGLVVFTIQRSFPQRDGTLTTPGLHAAVTVLRDDRGIPTITADDTHDLFFAQVQDLFSRRDAPAPVTGQDRLFLVVDTLLRDPDSPWWTNDRIGVSGMQEMLATAATDAYHRITALQGPRPEGWSWGRLHTLTLTSGTFGSSGIAPIEWLFNRGPMPVGGGSSVVDATGWLIGKGFDVATAPSMRMVVDLSDLDASTWNNLTGQSGHAFHPNYDDQVAAWQHMQPLPWPFSAKSVRAEAMHRLMLTPSRP